jgi:hypothetical protein
LGGLGGGVHTHVSKCRNDKVKGKNKAKQNEEKSVIQKQNSKKCQKIYVKQMFSLLNVADRQHALKMGCV